jgi:K+-transporting ATPase ATPase A chain
VNAHAWLLLGVYLSILLAAAAPLGSYLARVMDSDSSFALRMGRPLEMLIYRLSGVRADEQMGWLRYALAILIFNAVGVLAVYALQRLQAHLPLNLEALPAVSADSSFNTAVSFVTNTNWQGYGGEATMSYLTQMVGLAVQNFLSAATGIVVAIALIRGFARRSSATIGNAWVDLTRVTLYVLLPLCVIYAVFLVSQGVVQNFDAYRQATTLDTTHYTRSLADADGQARIDTRGAALTEAVTTRSQTLPMGPIASQESIKMLGTNGGGFLNANSAHPFENPTPLSNFIQMLSIFLIPAALCLCFGVMVGDKRQGWAVLAAMTLMFVVMAVAAITFEQQGNPLLAGLGVEHTVGNMEGKETRFGIADSGLFATITTLASCGAVNAMHDSFTPLGGLVPLGNMMLGEVVFGGVGTGLYGMLAYAVMAVFIAGLMIGRTPEYLGKKIEAFEMKMVSLAVLVTPLVVLAGTALAVSVSAGAASVANPGAHGFSEILYAFTSAGNNNGSAFAGLSANTPFYNLALGIAMWLGRFGVIVPVLAMAGALAAKKRLAASAGTMPTHGPLFVVLLIGTVVLIGALNYVPALALGPVVEHLMLWAKP